MSMSSRLRQADRRTTAPGSSSYPLTPPVGTRFSTGQDIALLSGPATAPAGAVTVTAGGTGLDALTTSNPAGTTFYLLAGTHVLGGASPTAFDQVQPKAGNSYIGAPGAILDGRTINRSAFTKPPGSSAANVTIKTIEIKGFVALLDQFCINPDSSSGWLLEGCTIHNNTGAAINLGSNGHLKNCWIYDNAQYGFSTYSPPIDSGLTPAVTNVTVEYCEIAGNGTWTDEYATGGPGPLGSGDPTYNGRNGGCKLWDTSGANIHHNWVHSNEHVALWADTNNINFTIEDNLVEDNMGEGFFYEISYNFVVRRNTFRRNAIFKGLNWATRTDDFPISAIYISESGGDATVGGGINSPSYIGGETEASANYFKDNWGTVTLWENSDRFCNSPSNTSGKIWKTLGVVGGVNSSLGMCNNPAAKVLTVSITAGSPLFTVTTGALELTDDGRPVTGSSGIPAGTKMYDADTAAGPWGYISATEGKLSANATLTGSITLTLNAGTINTEPGYTLCRWRTQNVKIKHNLFECDPVTVKAVYPTVTVPAGVNIGKTAVLAQVGTFPAWSPYTGNAVQNAITFNQGNVWANNAYTGTHVFMPFDTGTVKTFAQWQAAPYGQDAGSTGPSAPPPTAPGAPTGVTASALNSAAFVSWTAPADNGGSAITGYRITPYIGATAQTATTVGVSLSTTITGLTNGTAYTFKVAAINAVGTGTDSAPSSAVTPSPISQLLTSDEQNLEGTGTVPYTATFGCTIARSAAQAHGGTGSLAVTTTAGWAVELTTPKAATAGTFYTASLWMRETASQFPTLYMRFLDGGGGLISDVSVSPTESTTAWFQGVTASAAAPAGTASVKLVVQGFVSGQTVYLDDLSITSP